MLNRHCILQFIHTSVPSEAEVERFIVDNALTMDVWTIQGLLHMSLIPPYATSMTTSDTMPPSVWHYEKVTSKF